MAMSNNSRFYSAFFCNTHSLYSWLCGIFASFILMLGVGCTTHNNQAMADVERAEMLMEQHPDSALRIMHNVDRSQIHSNKDIAHYALVYSETYYYNSIFVADDSLTRVAAKYYKHSDDHDKRARAFFQHGQCLQQQRRMPEAILALTTSLNSLQHLDNPRLEGVVYRTIGEIYCDSYCYSNSLNYFKLSHESFSKRDLPYHSHYALYNMGQVYKKMHDYDKAKEHFITARDYAIASNNLDFMCATLHELCEIYYREQDYVRCSETLALFDKYDCVLWFISRYHALKAIVTSEQGDNNEALRQIAIAESIEQPEVAIIEEAKYHVYSNMGNKEQSLYWLEAINKRLDTNLLTAAEQPVLNYQIDLLQHKLDQEAQEIRMRRQRNIAIYIAIAVFATLFLGFIRSHISKKNRDIEHYMDVIHELQLTNSNTSTVLSEAVDKLYNDRLTDLNRLCETYYEHSDTSRHATKVFERVRETIESIKSDEARLEELEALVNNCRGNIMTKVRQQCPKLNSKELRVVLYSYAGFSSRAICIFMESNPVALSKVKYRIKTKIKESGAEDAELLISAITD